MIMMLFILNQFVMSSLIVDTTTKCTFTPDSTDFNYDSDKCMSYSLIYEILDTIKQLMIPLIFISLAKGYRTQKENYPLI